jgi:hypothetical protein
MEFPTKGFQDNNRYHYAFILGSVGRVGASNAGQPNVSKVLMMSQSKWFLQIKIKKTLDAPFTN